MYIDLINRLGGGPAADQVRSMQQAGMEVPGVVVLIASRPEWAAGLGQFTQAVMRGPGELPIWKREMIAALTSLHNHCVF